jgi:hypothetical protein
VHRRSLHDDARAVLAGPLPGEPLPEPALLPGLDAAALAAAVAHRISP